MVKKADQESQLDVTYTVTIHGYGKPSKIIDDMGNTLAKLVALNFNGGVVSRGKTTYRHELQKAKDGDGWGPLAKVVD